MPEEKEAQGEKKAEDTSSDKKEAQKEDPLAKFDQKYGSWIGRLEAQQKKDRETILSALNELKAAKEQPPANPFQQQEQPSGIKALNDKFAEKILQGNVIEALDEYTTLKKNAEEMLVKRTQTEMNKLLSTLEENEPIFKNVKNDVIQVAGNLVGQGYSPQDAVAFAWERSQAGYYKKLIASGGGLDPSSLETTTGGSQHEDAGSRKGKLNAEGKKAWEKNKDVKVGGKPLFKDEAEFIAQMNPRVRERFVG